MSLLRIQKRYNIYKFVLEACKRGSVGSHLTLALVSKAGEVTYVPLKVMGGGVCLFLLSDQTGLWPRKIVRVLSVRFHVVCSLQALGCGHKKLCNTTK